jgi:hypothetical protein
MTTVILLLCGGAVVAVALWLLLGPRKILASRAQDSESSARESSDPATIRSDRLFQLYQDACERDDAFEQARKSGQGDLAQLGAAFLASADSAIAELTPPTFEHEADHLINVHMRKGAYFAEIRNDRQGSDAYWAAFKTADEWQSKEYHGPLYVGKGEILFYAALNVHDDALYQPFADALRKEHDVRETAAGALIMHFSSAQRLQSSEFRQNAEDFLAKGEDFGSMELRASLAGSYEIARDLAHAIAHYRVLVQAIEQAHPSAADADWIKTSAAAVYERLGWCLEHTGDRPGAQQAYNKVLKDYSNSGEANLARKRGVVLSL